MSLDSLAAPRYLVELRDHWESTEPDLLQWFASSAEVSPEADEHFVVDLLKRSYRLEGGRHQALCGVATLLAGQLGLENPIHLYEGLNSDSLEARVAHLRVAGRPSSQIPIHIELSTRLLDLLDAKEQDFVVAHELAHAFLALTDHGIYGTIRHMADRLATDGAIGARNSSLLLTRRQLRTYSEVWADRVALSIAPDEAAAIGALVKGHQGVRYVDADSFRRLGRRLVERSSALELARSHPHLHLRIACLMARDTSDPEATVRHLVEGPDDLDRLDLFGQIRMAELARQVRGEPSLLADDSIASHQPSVRFFVAAQLADGGLAKGSAASGPETWAPFRVEAERLGVAAEFDKIVAKAMGRPVSWVRGSQP